MKVRLPPMKNHMHFRKQSDGHSWLVFTRPATGGRRSIAIIHIPDPHRDPTSAKATDVRNEAVKRPGIRLRSSAE